MDADGVGGSSRSGISCFPEGNGRNCVRDRGRRSYLNGVLGRDLLKVALLSGSTAEAVTAETEIEAEERRLQRSATRSFMQLRFISPQSCSRLPFWVIHVSAKSGDNIVNRVVDVRTEGEGEPRMWN